MSNPDSAASFVPSDIDPDAPQAPDAAARLAAARGALAALQARMVAEDAATEAAQELPRAELALANAQSLADARAKYGASSLAVVEVSPDHPIVILRKAPAPIYQRFQDEGLVKTDALWKLVSPSLVSPPAAAFAAIVDSLPVVLVRAADAIADLAGAGAAAKAKK